jgi:hypothetical protein
LQARRKDLLHGAAETWPFPVGPESLVWIMGMKKYDPAAPVEVIAGQDTIELVEKVNSPQGNPLRRVTVFHRLQMAQGQSQVKGYRVEDVEKKALLSVAVREVGIDRASGAIVPTWLELFWPIEKIKMDARLYSPEVSTSLKLERAIRLFSSPSFITEPGAKP